MAAECTARPLHALLPKEFAKSMPRDNSFFSNHFSADVFRECDFSVKPKINLNIPLPPLASICPEFPLTPKQQQQNQNQQQQQQQQNSSPIINTHTSPSHQHQQPSQTSPKQDGIVAQLPFAYPNTPSPRQHESDTITPNTPNTNTNIPNTNTMPTFFWNQLACTYHSPRSMGESQVMSTQTHTAETQPDVVFPLQMSPEGAASARRRNLQATLSCVNIPKQSVTATLASLPLHSTHTPITTAALKANIKMQASANAKASNSMNGITHVGTGDQSNHRFVNYTAENGALDLKRKKWAHEDMTKAIKLVKTQKMSVRAAAMMCHVPPSTLWDRLSGRITHGVDKRRKQPKLFPKRQREKT